MNVFNSVISPRVFSYRCVLHYFLTIPVGFNFNLAYGLKPQISGTKIVTVYRWSIFQVEWLIDTDLFFTMFYSGYDPSIFSQILIRFQQKR